MYKVIYTHKAIEDLKKIESSIAERIINKIAFYASQENPLDFAKRLQGNYEAMYRFRIGDFRAVFWVDRDGRFSILNILKIKHRKDVYGL
ncbi:MAG: type II toxin-antitoxin system RelE/ParE family toxin [Candidatus Peregrinibacteria bacterium]|nr:type II toxin-antitoxin system RelE/ParE family toxin [Candidatus Peregrinibacteria bacterium]